jgi:DNA polymerase-3 subunit epsilon
MARSADRQRALDWAADLVKQNTWVAFDAETTGLPGQLVSWAVVAPDGAELGGGLVKPTVPISEGARSIHGITDAMVASSPTFALVWPQIWEAIRDKAVVIYNASFDRACLFISARAAGITLPVFRSECAMTQYARFHGDWNEYHRDYRWKSLSVACERLGIPMEGAHTAAGDARATAAIVQAMAALALDPERMSEEARREPRREKPGIELFDMEKGRIDLC